MEIQNYRQFNDGNGCSIVLGLSNEDIEYIRKARDLVSLRIYKPSEITTAGRLLNLLDNTIAEAEKDNSQGIMAQEQRMKRGLEKWMHN